MKNPTKISRLESVPIREVWVGEATDFTPWLALEENLELLGEELDMKLVLEAVEQRVGSFYADIVCRDATDGSVVLIENQTQPTDHKHLGQICTYAGQLKASKIVWIAEYIRDEHREALEWLNNISDDEHSFYAVQVQAWKIDNSAPAPKFEVLARPALLTRETQKAVKKIASKDLSERQLKWKGYWDGFLDKARDKIPSSRSRVSYQGNWQTVLGRSGIGAGYIEFNVAASQTYVRTECYIGGTTAKLVFHALLEKRDEIEKKFGSKLTWEEKPGKQDSRVAAYMEGEKVDFETKSESQQIWLVENTCKLIDAILHHTDNLDLESIAEKLEQDV